MNTEEIKDELVHTECRFECCARAEICAAALLSGGIGFKGFGRYSLAISVTRANISRYYFLLIKKFLGITPEIMTTESSKLGKITRYELVFPDESVDMALEKLMLKDENALFGIRTSPAPEITEAPCCRSAFLKSAFLTNGSMSNPEKDYNLTITCAGEEMAAALRDIMASWDISCGTGMRRQQYVAYVKQFDSLRTFLAATGAHSAVLKLDDMYIVKQLKSQTNRQNNCDINNINRTVASAKKQIADILLLDQCIGLEHLPLWAREIARLRLENPEAPISEIGELCEPPLTKTCVSKRMTKLSQMASNLRSSD